MYGGATEEIFYFVKEKTSFNFARSACIKRGGKLFEPRSRDITLDLINHASLNGIDSFWLGIHKGIAHDGSYGYDSDDIPIEWSNWHWHNGEPKYNERRHNCAVVNGNGKWVDLPCNRSWHFASSVCTLPPGKTYQR